MDMLLIISNPASEQVALGLAAAATRSKVTWGAFFTNDGVKVLGNAEFAATVANAESAVACQDSWDHHMTGQSCPVELGSQTNNSLAVANAKRVVSL